VWFPVAGSALTAGVPGVFCGGLLVAYKINKSKMFLLLCFDFQKP
jgi:hypothetical protein